MKKFLKKKLSNGLRVVLVPMKDNPTVTVLILVETGSKYETKKINGVSHFLEHMCFKGTKKRPLSMDISKEFDSLGAASNAFTSQEYTGYYAKSDAMHFRQIFDLVSDIYLNSTFPEAEIEKEKGVIIEEINMYEDMPNRNVQDLFQELLYGDQPAGWSVLGTRENIRNMKRRDFVKYHQAHYVPEATTVVVSGDIKEKAVFDEIQKIFGRLPKSKKSPKLKVKEKQSAPAILLKYKKTDQAHFILGFRTFDIFNSSNPAMSVLSGILGGGMSSRLFQKLREEMGICYYVNASNTASTDHGYFEIAAGVDNKRIDEAVKAVLVECLKLKDNLVSEEELNKVKEYLIGNTKLSLESSDDLAFFYGGQEILKKSVEEVSEKFKRIKKVTPSDIKKLANQIFKENKLNFAVIGPFQGKISEKRFSSIVKL